MNLQGHVIVITGGSRGIGLAIAQRCLQAGASVVLAARKPEDLAAAQAACDVPDRVLTVETHTGQAAAVDVLFALAVERFGKVDGLVNNAATNPYFGPLIDTPDAAFDKTLEVNLKGYFYCARALVKHLRGRGAAGAIVNVASVAGLRAAPMQGSYGMSKAAVISMTQTLAAELGPSQIRVNAIAPGLVETKFARAIVENPMLRDHVIKRTPLGNHGKPEDIAGAATFLLSPEAAFVTGACWVLDGGWTVA